jgi:hypothetical protein
MCSLAKDRYLSHHAAATTTTAAALAAVNEILTDGVHRARPPSGSILELGSFLPLSFADFIVPLPIVDYFSYITTFFRQPGNC